MNTKEINRESGRIFRSLLMPNWADRSQEDQEDYGIDYEIEVMTQDDRATGFIFKVQLKGSSVAKYDKSERLLFSDASVERFKYYIAELRTPLIFVVCDVTTGDCFWIRVQGNRQIETAFQDAVKSNQKTFTIKIPTSHKIQKSEASAEEILESVEIAQDTITLRGLKRISHAAIREHFDHEADIHSSEKRLRFWAGIASTASIRKLIQIGDLKNAIEKAYSLFDSELEPPEVRLNAGLIFVQAMADKFRQDRLPDAATQAVNIRLKTAAGMLRISRKMHCDMAQRGYVRIYARASRMMMNGQTVLALVISEKAQEGQGQTFCGSITRLHRSQISRMVSHDFFKLCNSLRRMGCDGFFSLMPYALNEIAEAVWPFVTALRIQRRSDLADAFVDALFDWLPFCIQVVRKFKAKNEISEILTRLGLIFIGFADISNSESLTGLMKRFEQNLQGEPRFECIDDVTKCLLELIESIEADRSAKSKPTMDQLRAHYQQQAAGLGVDLSDQDDEVAKIINIGLKDLDPTRVVKQCHHIHLMFTSAGIPAQMLNLPTAGFKRITCLKHGHSLEALSLDTAYQAFVRSDTWPTDQVCCINCPDKVPHPDGWGWSEEWSSMQHLKYVEAYEPTIQT